MSQAYLDRVAAFAATLRDEAELLDGDSSLLARRFEQFAAQGLHLAGGPREPLPGREFCEALALLAETSGAFAFLALQQIVANGMLAGAVGGDAAWPAVGVAFGHLRNPIGRAPAYVEGVASGMVPWMSGAGVFPEVILGVRGPEGEEIYALVDARDRPEFRYDKPMLMVACSSTCTTSVRVERLAIPETAILKRQPRGSLAANDRNSVLYQTPLMVGCVRACLRLIEASGRVPARERAACERAAKSLLDRVYSAFDGCPPETGQQLRAKLGDFTSRIARLTVMASGGAGLLRAHPGQRLYREALLYSLMAQTDEIVTQAFTQVFP